MIFPFLVTVLLLLLWLLFSLLLLLKFSNTSFCYFYYDVSWCGPFLFHFVGALCDFWIWSVSFPQLTTFSANISSNIASPPCLSPLLLRFLLYNCYYSWSCHWLPLTILLNCYSFFLSFCCSPWLFPITLPSHISILLPSIIYYWFPLVYFLFHLLISSSKTGYFYIFSLWWRSHSFSKSSEYLYGHFFELSVIWDISILFKTLVFFPFFHLGHILISFCTPLWVCFLYI